MKASLALSTAGALALVLALAQPDASAQSSPRRSKGDLLSGRAKIVDGAMLDVGSERVRLWGIDTPASGDWCYRRDQRWRPAAESATGLRGCLADKKVTCRVQKAERRWFRLRYVAECWTDDGQDLGECLIRTGWATDYTCYSDGFYADQETEARNKRLGLWSCDNGAPTRRWGRHGPGTLCETPAYKPQGPGS